MGHVRPLASVIALCLSSGVARAQIDLLTSPDTGSDIARSVVPMLRIEVPPVIDGSLDDDIWADAPLLSGFRQIEPTEGALPSHETEVRVLYDSRNIYFAIRCFDSEPDRIIATQMLRDGSLESDDRIVMLIDTFHDHRNAYQFEVNPLGSRSDALVEGVRTIIRDWDGIWYAKATTDELGWTAEIQIPFTTISFDPDSNIWGFQISRVIRRTNEQHRWTSIDRNRSFSNMAHAGDLTGLEDLEQGVGLDIRPYFLGRYKYDNERSRDGIDIDAGLDLFYKLTPSTTLALTVNTDFAETEVDERRINLTRFPLFFPEKRDFFLQDAGIFAFGGIRSNPLPFQSRRIGLTGSGEPIDILAGVKITGRQGPINFGLLSTQMKHDDELGNKTLSIGRASYNVFEESTVGAIFTAGDPTHRGDNYLGGLDFNFRTSDFGDGQTLTSNVWVQQSYTSGQGGDDVSFGARLMYPNDRIRWGIGGAQIGDDFNAALGFVPRRGIREYFGDWRYRWRPGGTEQADVRSMDAGFRAMVITNLDDQIESQSVTITAPEIRWNSGNQVQLQAELRREVLERPFGISDGVVIPAGDYRFNRFGAEFSTSSGRPISVDLEVNGGEFFTGSRWATGVGVEWRASEHLLVGTSISQNDVFLPEGNFTTRIVSGRVNIYFTPDISWNNFIQYDNVSDSIGLNSRLRWIVEPGQEVFVVINQGFAAERSRFTATDTSLTTKVGVTLRY